MNDSELRERTLALVLERAAMPVEDLAGSETLIGDLGYDSLSLLELIDALESELQIAKVPDAMIGALETIADIEALALGAFAAANGETIG